MKYKIYKMIHNGVVVYIGSTTLALGRRWQIGYKHNKNLHPIHTECIMELIEETDDVSRESYWIDYYKDTVLNIISGKTGKEKKQWRKDYYKEYYQKNKESYKEKYQKNKLKNEN